MQQNVMVSLFDDRTVTCEIDYEYSPPETVSPEPGSSIQGRIPGEVRINEIIIIGVDTFGEYVTAESMTDAQVKEAREAVEDHFEEVSDRIYEVLGYV